MITLNNINNKLDHFDKNIQSQVDAGKLTMATLKESCMLALASGQAKSKENAMECIEIWNKFKKSESDTIQLENAEFKVLKDLIEQNSAQHIRFFHAQILTWLYDCEKSKN